MLEGFEHGRRWVILGCLILCHVYFFQIYSNFVSPNELTRLLLTSAIVDDHSLSIDRALKRFGNTQDKANFNGHYYSDKAIGTSLLGIPAFFLLRIGENATGIRASTQEAIFWVRLFTVTIPSILFLRILAGFWMALRPASRLIPYFLFLHLFGTIAFTYSGQFVSHYLLGIFLFCSALYLNEARSKPDHPKHIIFSGLFAGISLLMEFPAVIPVFLICLFALFALRNLRKLLYFALPIIVFIGLILGYNYAIFGTLWDVTYRHMTHDFHKWTIAQGFIGMAWPKPKALYDLLFSRHHGLFFISPFLLLCIPGFYRLITAECWSFIAKLFVGITLATVLIYGSYSSWIGGWNFGPRYITAVVPFLSTGAFYFADEFLQKSFLNRMMFTSVAIWSVICVTVSTITFPFPPDQLTDPIFFLNMSLLMHNTTGQNLCGNVWFFFVLIILTFLIMTFSVGDKQLRISKILRGLAAISFSILLFSLAFLSAPKPSAMDYYVRGWVYVYIGNYAHSLEEMKLALAASSDANTRTIIQKRISYILRMMNS